MSIPKSIVSSLLMCMFYAIFGQFSYTESLPRPGVWDTIKHVVIIPLENSNVEEALEQPYLRYLTTKGAFLSDYHAVTHPSQPNYIAMVAGETFGIFNDCNVTLKAPTIADLLETASLTWKVYAEDYPGQCFLDATFGLYARKHVPFLSFKKIQTNPSRCSNIVTGTQFFVDMRSNSLPSFSMYIPNLENDGHNTGVAYASEWLRTVFGPIFDDRQRMNDTLFIITFDEGDFFSSNKIYTLFIGAGVNPGYRSRTHYTHYSMLKTIENIFKIGDLGKHDRDASLISDIWRF